MMLLAQWSARALAALLLVQLQPTATKLDCESWNSSEFFEKTTIDTIKHCLAAGTDFNVHDADGYTVLHYAASNVDSPDVVTALVGAGADPNARDNSDVRGGPVCLDRLRAKLR